MDNSLPSDLESDIGRRRTFFEKLLDVKSAQPNEAHKFDDEFKVSLWEKASFHNSSSDHLFTCDASTLVKLFADHISSQPAFEHDLFIYTFDKLSSYYSWSITQKNKTGDTNTQIDRVTIFHFNQIIDHINRINFNRKFISFFFI